MSEYFSIQMSIISYLIDNYFKIMKSINVRSVSIAIIVLIILIEFLELFIKPEDTEQPQKNQAKNKEEKSSLLRKMVKLDKKTIEKKDKKPFEKDELNNYYKVNYNESGTEKSMPINEELEVLGSKTIEINTIIEGNRIYMEKKEKNIQD